MHELSYHVGADENGLGPQLGPLVVTAVMARVRAGSEPLIHAPADGDLARRLGDSKLLLSHKNHGLGEAWSRVLVQRGAGKKQTHANLAELLESLFLDGIEQLQAPCPKGLASQCWNHDRQHLASGARMAAWLERIAEDLDGLQKRGVEVMAVRSVVVCTQALNQASDAGMSRLQVDLHAMERLVLAMRALAGAEVQAVCGKVGGYTKYENVFGPLAAYPRTVLCETRANSRYRVAGVGEVSFSMDCDASNLLVGLASLVGKFVREALMARIVHFYQRADDSLEEVSGYHDKRSKRFVLATADQRHKGRVPVDCFLRRKAQRP